MIVGLRRQVWNAGPKQALKPAGDGRRADESLSKASALLSLPK